MFSRQLSSSTTESLEYSSSSCAKFILAGEHSVIHEGFGLAFPIRHLRMQFNRHIPDAEAGFYVNNLKLDDNSWNQIQDLHIRIGAPSSEFKKGLHIQSQIPVGSGLGSSAALSLLLAKKYFPHLNRSELALKALEGEKVFHATPSGIDPFTVSLEEAICFRSAGHEYQILNLESFRSQDLCIVAKNSGVRHRTGEVLKIVQRLKQDNETLWKHLIHGLAAQSEKVLGAFLGKSAETLGTALTETHRQLNELGVSCAELNSLVDEMKKQGALGAKLTGAGRGGCVIGLFRRQDLLRLDPSYFLVFE